jgi:hypothetical protein
MVEFTVQIEESTVQTFGHAYIEEYLQSVVKTIVLKAAAKDILDDLNTVDFRNEYDWQAARHLAWQQEQHKYLGVK